MIPAQALKQILANSPSMHKPVEVMVLITIDAQGNVEQKVASGSQSPFGAPVPAVAVQACAATIQQLAMNQGTFKKVLPEGSEGGEAPPVH